MQDYNTANSLKKVKMTLDDSETAAIMKQSEPMRLTNIMVKRPCLVVSLSYLCMIVLTVIVSAVGWVTPSDNTPRDFLVWGNRYVNDYDKS